MNHMNDPSYVLQMIQMYKGQRHVQQCADA